MRTHYIPRLMLRHFANNGKVNTYNFESFATKKLKAAFMEENLYDEKLEKAFATKLEGPFADLLNHKLLNNETVSIDRRENLLLRKFLMINFLRAPIVNCTWDEMIKRTRLENHPSVQMEEYMRKCSPEFARLFERALPSEAAFVPNLIKAMEADDISELLPKQDKDFYDPLEMAAIQAFTTVIAIWDCEACGQEFILPKLPGINEMDTLGIMHKAGVISECIEDRKKKGLYGDNVGWRDKIINSELGRLLYGSCVFSENYSIHPISPTRAIINFSPYFRAFFPTMDFYGEKEEYPALLDKKQFDKHFYQPMRMELFRPCRNIMRRIYCYEVKQLTWEETCRINSMLLDMETEEFAFHDFNKIRDSLWYYDRKAQFAFGKKHDFSSLYY